MRRELSRVDGYAAAVAAVALITVAIALIRLAGRTPDLAMVYLLGVLWLGARYGRGPAVGASLLSFLAYDFFFVPPFGTLAVAGPVELVGLLLLLAAALVTGQLADAQRRASRRAEAAAEESATLYAIATAALRSRESGAAFDRVAERAREVAGVEAFSVVAVDDDAVVLAGDPLPADVLRRARWSFDGRRPVGARLADGRLQPFRSIPDAPGPALVPLDSGVVAIKLDGRAGEDTLRLLGGLTALAGLLLDRRRAEIETERARSLAESDQLKGAILSSISHELKTPIASLRAGLTALTSPASGLSADHRELVGGLDGQADRLDRLVGDMLTMSRLEAGLALDLQARSFAELAGSVIRRIRARAGRHRVVLHIAPDLPDVLADEVQLERVLANLLENAFEWAPEGTDVEVGAERHGDELRVWVANEGPRIPPADLRRVFDKFWTTRTGGTGLGLAISRRIVQAHGGRISAANTRTGPRFTFTLPLARMPVA
jgi:two-component system sensor histidine kinase KdpD